MLLKGEDPARGDETSVQVFRTVWGTAMIRKSSLDRGTLMATGSNWASDLFVGALGSGVNFTTLIAVNFVTLLAVLSLLFLLFTVQGDPELWPHVVVLLVFAAGLHGSSWHGGCRVGGSTHVGE